MGYPKGIRENGGQYTHAAMFAVYGLFECAKKIKETDPEHSKKFKTVAEKILMYSNPAYRQSESASEYIRAAYKSEPYAMAADIYTNHEHKGRGGWTHYTGSSGWYYRMFLKYVLGFSLKSLDVNPHIVITPPDPIVFGTFTDKLTLCVREFGFNLEILYQKSKNNDVKDVVIYPHQKNTTVLF